MKKGIIMKVSKNYITVLSELGQYEKLKPKSNASVGQQIFYFKQDLYSLRNKKMFKFASVAAAFLIVITMFTLLQYDSIFVNAKTYAIVTVDINPSIEISIDKDNKVLGIKSLNDDGTKIISKTMIGKSLNEVLDYILQNAKANGYLLKQGSVLIATAIVSKDSVQNDVYGTDNINNYNTETVTGKGNSDVDVASNTGSNDVTDNDLNSISNDSNGSTPEVTDENSSPEDTSNNITESLDEVNAGVVNNSRLDEFINQYMQSKTDEYSFVYIKGSLESLKSAKSQGLSLGKYEILKYLSSDVTQEDIKSMKVADIVERKDFKNNTKSNNNSLEVVSNNETDSSDDTKAISDNDASNKNGTDTGSANTQVNSDSNSNNKNNKGNSSGKQVVDGVSTASQQDGNGVNGNSNKGKGQIEAGEENNSTDSNDESTNQGVNEDRNEDYNNSGKNKDNNNENESNKEKNKETGKEKDEKQTNKSSNDVNNNSESDYTNNNQNEDEYYNKSDSGNKKDDDKENDNKGKGNYERD